MINLQTMLIAHTPRVLARQTNRQTDRPT